MTTPVSTLGAIVALFDADATLAASFPGNSSTPAGLWVDEIPETLDSLPFAALEQQGEPTTQIFANVALEEGEFELHVYALGLAAVEALAKQVKVVLGPKRNSGIVYLPLGGGCRGWIQLRDYRVEEDKARDKNGNRVHHATLTYKSTVERAL